MLYLADCEPYRQCSSALQCDMSCGTMCYSLWLAGFDRRRSKIYNIRNTCGMITKQAVEVLPTLYDWIHEHLSHGNSMLLHTVHCASRIAAAAADIRVCTAIRVCTGPHRCNIVYCSTNFQVPKRLSCVLQSRCILSKEAASSVLTLIIWLWMCIHAHDLYPIPDDPKYIQSITTLLKQKAWPVCASAVVKSRLRKGHQWALAGGAYP